ncbi:sulfurtransferase TusA family protein [Bermanella marisrubri]|uniref:UPF0033 domain-containing protein n=1 Tax=Bermanella marisrubri TaxID=207949 RepID=Q1N0S7_9GAMM|nr:sulfurtransferase TusA family protein [Bermanella marisrubri]EAT11756.1 hypothetical protein RED65_05199 [Oceanobacter sp. RED65] [Bermanella marisrubri]QIZ83792.1 sulfurtransferase TusA family protein [Bermanella marisrubri]
MTDIQVDHTLDAVGLRCPMPLLKTKQALSSLQPKEVLKVVATDAGAKRDIPAFVALTAHRLLDSLEQSELFIFYIEKGE